MANPYSGITFLTARQELANRLNDPTKQFWPDAELKLYIQDAIAFWNCLTGDNKTVYALSVNPATVWYDLQTIVGSPRIATLNDQDLYLRMSFMLLEAGSATVPLTTNQFILDDLVQGLQRKRDEFLFRTGCTSVVETLLTTPTIPTVALPQKIIQVRRAYWLPQVIIGITPNFHTLFRNDEYGTASYNLSGPTTPGEPLVFSAGMEPLEILELTPAPLNPGNVEILALESQATLTPPPGAPVSIFMPNDFIPALVWGTLADLLNKGLEAQDQTRSEYAMRRFEEYVALMGSYPFVFSARVGNVPTYADAVEVLDIRTPGWRSGNTSPAVIGLSGQNLVAFPSPTAKTITLLMLANATIPVADADFIQYGDEIIDVILDEAQSTASFKMGGAEFSSAIKLHGNMIKLAAQRNAKVRALSIFRDILYDRAQKREEHFAPMEEVATE